MRSMKKMRADRTVLIAAVLLLSVLSGCAEGKTCSFTNGDARFSGDHLELSMKIDALNLNQDAEERLEQLETKRVMTLADQTKIDTSYTTNTPNGSENGRSYAFTADEPGNIEDLLGIELWKNEEIVYPEDGSVYGMVIYPDFGGGHITMTRSSYRDASVREEIYLGEDVSDLCLTVGSDSELLTSESADGMRIGICLDETGGKSYIFFSDQKAGYLYSLSGSSDAIRDITAAFAAGLLKDK